MLKETRWCPEEVKSKIRFREKIKMAVDMQVVVNNSYACAVKQSTGLRGIGLVSRSA